MKRIIIEGITGSGKTTILKLLRNKLIEQDFSNLFLISQFYTNSIIYNSKSNDAETKSYNILENICNIIENYDKLYENYGTKDKKRRFSSILECFHIENFAKKYMKDFQLFKNLDMRIAQLGYKMIILYLPEKDIIERSIISTRIHRNSKKWNDYLINLGNNNEEIKKYFLDVQDSIIFWAKNSIIPYKIISTENMEWEKYIDEIMLFSNSKNELE